MHMYENMTPISCSKCGLIKPRLISLSFASPIMNITVERQIISTKWLCMECFRNTLTGITTQDS